MPASSADGPASSARDGLRPGRDALTFVACWSPTEKAQVSQMLSCAFVGSPDTVRGKLEGFLARTGADELMIGTPVFDHGARVRSMELLAEIGTTLGAREAA